MLNLFHKLLGFQNSYNHKILPVPLLAVPYAAPRALNTIAAVAPMTPKNATYVGSSTGRGASILNYSLCGWVDVLNEQSDKYLSYLRSHHPLFFSKKSQSPFILEKDLKKSALIYNLMLAHRLVGVLPS